LQTLGSSHLLGYDETNEQLCCHCPLVRTLSKTVRIVTGNVDIFAQGGKADKLINLASKYHSAIF
jgi:hypothetical protein